MIVETVTMSIVFISFDRFIAIISADIIAVAVKCEIFAETTV